MTELEDVISDPDVTFERLWASLSSDQDGSIADRAVSFVQEHIPYDNEDDGPTEYHLHLVNAYELGARFAAHLLPAASVALTVQRCYSNMDEGDRRIVEFDEVTVMDIAHGEQLLIELKSNPPLWAARQLTQAEPVKYDDEPSLLFAGVMAMFRAYVDHPDGDSADGTLQAIEENLEPY